MLLNKISSLAFKLQDHVVHTVDHGASVLVEPKTSLLLRTSQHLTGAALERSGAHVLLVSRPPHLAWRHSPSLLR